MTKTKFSLYACCVIVAGANRDIIVDLQNIKIYYLPKSLSKILKKQTFSFDYNDEINAFLEFLLNENVVFENKSNFSFPRLSFDKDFSPFQIESVILLIENGTDFKNSFEWLQKFSIRYLRLELFHLNSELVNEVFQYLNTLSVSHIELVAKDTDIFNLSQTPIFLKNIFIISSTIILEPEIDKFGRGKYYIKENIFEKPLIPSFDNFRINIDIFNEALFSNVFYNNRIYIKGNLISNEYEFINTVETSSICDNNELNIFLNSNIYNIPKDEILVCKDCEYRYICVDSRKVKSDQNKYYYEDNCNYNPYNNSWN